MENQHIPLLFLLTFMLLSCSMSFVSSISQLQISPKSCLDDQRSALVELQLGLYHSHQDFTFSSKAALWDINTDCCSWEGVMCDSLGHVIGLDLNYRNLSGSFHSIFNLHHLQKLNLAGNNFNTSLFSSRFDRLPNLTHLNLSTSCFHGQVPVGISYLTRLVSLDLSSQDMCDRRSDQIETDDYLKVPSKYITFLKFSSTLDLYSPPTLKLEIPNLETIITNMKSLTELYLDGVDISGQSDKWCETISMALPKLQVLSLSSCDLTGPLCSSLSRLQFLSKLNLNHNPISYLPPNFLEIAAPLVSLSLEDCNLSGNFPINVFLFPKIQRIDISENYHLSGQLPEFPLNNTLQVLSLHDTNFGGNLPKSIGNLMSLIALDLSYCNFSGQIPSSIANLTNLVELDLRYNQLQGSLHSTLFTLPSLKMLAVARNELVGEIPEFPNASSSLIEYLFLSRNHFTGTIPQSILQLPRLEGLYLNNNSFGPVKLDIFSQLKRLRHLGLSNISLSTESLNKNSLSFPKLEYLVLSSCNLTKFPEFIKTQDKLVALFLSNNQIRGLVPTWLWKSSLLLLNISFNAIDFPQQFHFNDANYRFPMLRRLYLQACNLSVFPEFLKSQENLEYLDISDNRISGAVPSWMWKKSLRELYLSNNHLSYLDQFPPNQSITYPRPICNLSQLVVFNASRNNLSGQLSNCFANISTLRLLDLQGNNFTGNLPNFARAAQLVIFKASENKLYGQLPRSLVNCTKLEVLDVGNNMLYDTFPFWLGKLPALEVLVLRGNRFHGEIKHLLEHDHVFSALDVLDIASNDFSGEPSLDFLQATQLRSLKIGGNKLKGKLPRSLSNCTKLEVLDLRNNMVYDTFPFWLMLPSLKVLVLRANRFYGAINISGSTENVFPMLRILDIASNNFSGNLPIQFFQCLKAMMQITNGSKAKLDYIGDDYYQDSVTIVNKGFEIFYQKILTIFACLDVSNNGFHGRIPEEIKNLISLKVLNLSHNSFSGPIPSALENLTELESLDLSKNNLSEKIPLQLNSLTFLAALNLSYNQLEGSIPKGNQFNTFSNDSYRGNPRLCGPPLTRKCNEVGDPSVPLPPAREDVDSWGDGISVWKIALIGYGGGLVIGLCVGFTVLNEWGNKWLDRFKRTRRRFRRRS